MSYYHTCPDCGANLDPGEHCDCRSIKQPKHRAGCFIIGFDLAQDDDCVGLTVGRKMDGKLEILNSYQDDEAREMYNKLVTRAPEGKVKLL